MSEEKKKKVKKVKSVKADKPAKAEKEVKATKTKKEKGHEAGAGLQGKKEKKAKKDKPLSLSGTKALNLKKLRTAGDLKEAEYNPRQISAARLNQLSESIASFGDLSGIVFNGSAESGVLISGHQRIKSVQGWETSVEVTPAQDDHGTVGLGYLHAVNPETSKKVSFPLRVVNWSDKRAEYAANIAANAHGGEFDNRKLASLVDTLNIETISPSILGFDTQQIRSLKQRYGGEKTKNPKEGQGRLNGSSGAFTEISEDEMEEELQHKCPRCHFQF